MVVVADVRGRWKVVDGGHGRLPVVDKLARKRTKCAAANSWEKA